jgi:hypothetical protein
VEVTDRQQVCLALGQPGARGGALALGTVPVAAAVIGDPPMAAVLAGLDVTAQSRRAAMLDLPAPRLGGCSTGLGRDG